MLPIKPICGNLWSLAESILNRKLPSDEIGFHRTTQRLLRDRVKTRSLSPAIWTTKARAPREHAESPVATLHAITRTSLKGVTRHPLPNGQQHMMTDYPPLVASARQNHKIWYPCNHLEFLLR